MPKSIIITQYPYRLNPIIVFMGCLFSIPGGIWMMSLPYSIPCSDDKLSINYCSEEFEVFYILVMVFFGVGNTLAGIYLFISFIKSRIDPFRRKVAFTDHSIIGPCPCRWSVKEKELDFSTVTDLKLVHNKQGQSIIVSSPDLSLVIEYRCLKNKHFYEIYNRLAVKFQRPPYEEVMGAYLSLKGEEKGLIRPTLYLVAPILLLAFFGSKISMQIDHDGLFIAGVLINFAILVTVVKFNKKFMTSTRKRIKIPGYLFIGLAFSVSLFGNMALMSFLNQLGDKSATQTLITTVIEEGGQTEESIKENGKCYDLIDIIDPEATFGRGDLCEKTHPGIAQKKVKVFYRQGNFSQRWAVKYEVMKGI